MAWTEKLPTGRYRAGWRDEDGSRRYSARGADGKPFIHKAAAARYAGEQEGKARRGETGPRVAEVGTWGAWSEEWFAARRCAASTKRNDRYTIDAHLDPKWGRAKLHRITRAQVQKWADDLTEAHSAGTVARIVHTFSGSMKAAVLAGKIPANPVYAIDLPPILARPLVSLTRDEFDAAIENMAGAWRACACLLVGTGLRWGEAAGLHWSNVDLLSQRVYVQDVLDPETQTIRPFPKGKVHRIVPLPDWVAVELLPFASEATTCGLRHTHGGRCTSDLVFRTATGEPLEDHNMRSRGWHPALDDAGVDRVRLHDLRHTTATWWREAGLPLDVVQELLGHRDIKTTQIYAHLGDRNLGRALDIMQSPEVGTGPKRTALPGWDDALARDSARDGDSDSGDPAAFDAAEGRDLAGL